MKYLGIHAEIGKDTIIETVTYHYDVLKPRTSQVIRLKSDSYNNSVTLILTDITWAEFIEKLSASMSDGEKLVDS